MRDFFKILSLLFVSLIYFKPGYAQTSWKGTTSSNWSIASNWTNGLPDSTKDAILGDANFTGIYQPIANVNTYCKSVTIGGTVATTLNINRGFVVINNITINSNGAVIQGNSIASLRGNWINHGSYSISNIGARVIFAGTAQTIGGSALTSFNRINIDATSNVTMTSNVIISGTTGYLYLYGVLDPGQSPTYKLTVTGNLRVYDKGKLKVNAATFAGNYAVSGIVTLFGGSIVDYSSTVVDQTISYAYTYSTLIISGTGTKSLAGNLPNIYSANAAMGKILVNSGTLDLKTFTANRGVTTVGGELKILDGAFVKVAGASNFPGNFSSRVLSPLSNVEYGASITQNISSQTYGNLLMSGTGIKNAYNPFTVMGNLIITNGTLNTGTFSVTHSVAKDFIMTGGAITGTNAIYSLIGTTDQNLSLMSNVIGLTINKTAGAVIMGSNITVSNTLNFIKGNLQTGVYKVILTSTATVSGADQTTGWVNGSMQKNVTTGSAVYRTFEVGGNSDYSPANVLFATVTTAGNLTAKAAAIDQPEINYSGIEPDKSVNRFWSMTNSGIVFSTATSTFNWVTSDVDGGAVPADFKAGIFNGTTWTLPGITDIQPTSIKATGITSFGDFAVGEGISLYTWSGDAFTNNWFTPQNWLGGIPSGITGTLIPTGMTGGRLYPVVSTGTTATVHDITVENGSTLTVAGTLQFKGRVSSSGAIIATAGTIEFNGSIPQAIPPGIFAGNTIQDLIISNEVHLSDTDTLTGTLYVGAGRTFFTHDHLVLKSSATGTARIASLPVDGAGVATAFITGAVSIERYIPARKAWRLLSAPIKPGTATINSAWQEGVNGSSFGANPNPGYGVRIAGGTLLNGFDQSPTNLPTIKVYDNASDGYIGLPPYPGTNVPINSYPGYLLYIRGDRSVDLMQGANAPVTSTTLRIKGEVNTGNKTVNVAAGYFSVMGNPYPSAIDFQTLTRNNVKNTFYVWDPKLAGENGLGGYVTVSWNSATSSYDITSAASPVSQYIPSGAAVLVVSNDNQTPGTVIIKESDKTTNGSDMLFGRPGGLSQKLRTNLYAVNTDGTNSLLDAALITYHADHLNIIDNDDVNKMKGGSENIGIQRDGKILSIERRKAIAGSDTAFLNLIKMKTQSYKLEIIAENLSKTGMIGFLKDNYSNTINNTPLDLNGTTSIEFQTTVDPASYAENRFSIVFARQPALAVIVKTNAGRQQKNSSVAKISVEENAADKMTLFPNPVVGNAVSLQLNNVEKGIYNVQVSDMKGQVVKMLSIKHEGGTANHRLSFDNSLPFGKYQVKLTNGANVSITCSMIRE